MKKYIVLVLAVVLAASWVGCGTSPTKASDWNIVSLNGASPNLSFISFTNMGGLPGDGQNPQIIGNAVLGWEQNNPGRRVISMQIVYQPYGYATRAKVDGIFIYSEPK